MQTHKTLSGFFLILFSVFSCSHIIYAQEIDDYLLWAKVSEFPSYSDAIANQSDLDADENLYVIGTFFKLFPWDQDPTKNVGMQQIFVRKYDTNGNLLWSKEFGTGKYYSYGGDIRVDKLGDIVVTGYLYDPDGTVFGQPVPGFFISKFDKHGNLVWIASLTKTYLWTWGERIGHFCKQSKMEIDKDNSIVVYSNGNPAGVMPNPVYGLYISRYSSEGALLQQHQITHDDNFDSPGIGGLAIDKDGNFIVTGYYHVGLKIGPVVFGKPGPQSDTPVRLYVAKFSSTGSFLWAKEVEWSSIGFDVEVDNLNSIYLTGMAHGHARLIDDMVELNPSEFYGGFIAKLSADGQTVWSKAVGTYTYPMSLKRTDSGDLYISGACYKGIAYENFKLVRPEEQSFVLKINADRSFGGAILSDSYPIGYTFKSAYNSSIDNEGNIYTIGNFNQRIVFGCDTLHSPGYDMFITKYSSLPPGYALDISGPATLCNGTNLVLSAITVPEPVKYLWTLPSGVAAVNQIGNQLTASVAPSANSMEVSVAIRKSCYNYQGPDPYKIKMQFTPGSNTVLGQPMYCEPGTVGYYSTGSMNATEYHWSLPEGITAKLNTPVTSDPFIDVILSEDFNDGVISAKGKNECFEGGSSLPFRIRVIKKPTPISFVNMQDEFCNRGQTEIFEVTKSDRATEYVWTIPSVMKEVGTVTSAVNMIDLTMKDEGSGLLSVYAMNVCHKTEPVSYLLNLTNPLADPQIFKSACDRELKTDGAENIQWFKNRIDIAQGVPAIILSEEGEYFVTVSNFCGTNASSTVVANPVMDERLFIPNVITPNSDGKNDLLTFKPDMEELSLQIFNRWGEPVYGTADYRNDWDAAALATGIYYIQLKHACLEKKYQSWLQVIK